MRNPQNICDAMRGGFFDCRVAGGIGQIDTLRRRRGNAAVRDPLTIYTHFILSSSIFATLRCCCFCSSSNVAVKRKAVTTLVGGLFERLVSTSRAFYYCYSQYKGIWWVLYDNTLALSPRGNVNYFPLTPITKWIVAAAAAVRSSVTINTTNDIFFTTPWPNDQFSPFA